MKDSGKMVVRRIRLPAWVANSPPVDRSVMLANSPPVPNSPPAAWVPAVSPVCFHYRSFDSPAPLWVPMEGKFRERFFRPRGAPNDSYTTRCQVPRYLPQVRKDLLHALAAMKKFLDHVKEEGVKLYGAEGVNPGMAKTIACMVRCFDFDRMTTTAPSVEDIKSFLDFYHQLLPFLKHSDWPSQHAFRDLQRA
jgi:hypothetical protein